MTAQEYQSYIEVIAYHDDRQFDQNERNDRPENQPAGRVHEGTVRLRPDRIEQYLQSFIGMNIAAYLHDFHGYPCDQLQFRAVVEQDQERIGSLLVGGIVMQPC